MSWTFVDSSSLKRTAVLPLTANNDNIDIKPISRVLPPRRTPIVRRMSRTPCEYLKRVIQLHLS
ncbi:hypothetical protein EXIGLDRAFT_736623 [Exidia glandulosa HHB12029]|uniref:Uncharacterized protein n=1 Tax=Exidia glandulosa HHB12029 TaxID=1314781 RepID=A0A165JB82_EXIGL|nr:hypothetical protein EXIGLDRAFT_736623 [Exidia glandulosa HHB12029]